MNLQQRTPVNRAWLARVARCTVRRLGIRTRGTLAITLIDARRMRTLNRRFLSHDRPTDVLSFRYAGERTTVGEILIAPAAARRYAQEHALPYAEELARYVVHGILHWTGRRDATTRERAHMRRREDRLLAQCGALGRGR